MFNPLNFKQNKFIPPVYITDINFLKVKENAEKEKIIGNDKPLYLSGKIRIPHSYNSFTVHFASLSYVEPEKNLFSYKMEGLDKSWMNQTKSNSVTYTNLAPGKYCLYVKGSNKRPSMERQGCQAANHHYSTLVFISMGILRLFYFDNIHADVFVD